MIFVFSLLWGVLKMYGDHKQIAIKSEISVLKSLHHKNIVRFYEEFKYKKHQYIVMEYIYGDNLRSYIKSQPKGRLCESLAKKIFIQLLNGIVYCHNKNISHRDIKMENILITKEGYVKIIDFGFSLCITNDEKLKSFCGTPSYMAPEIVAKKDYSGKQADVWAMGILLYIMLTGSFPFKGYI